MELRWSRWTFTRSLESTTQWTYFGLSPFIIKKSRNMRECLWPKQHKISPKKSVNSIHPLTSGNPGSGRGGSRLFQKSLFPATLSSSSWGVPRPDEICNPPSEFWLWPGVPSGFFFITHWWKYNYKSSISAPWWIKICTLDLSFLLNLNVFIYLD